MQRWQDPWSQSWWLVGSGGVDDSSPLCYHIELVSLVLLPKQDFDSLFSFKIECLFFPKKTNELKDRLKDIIISGGENISSIEIEEVLYKHSDVSAVAVVAAPHEKWGETPCAFVELKTGCKLSSSEFREQCKQYLAGFKLPSLFVFGPISKTST